VTVERGLDPREFVLVAFGGGGGLFAAATAAELEIPTVVIPRFPANFSAWGILTSDYREDVALTRVRPLSEETVPSIKADLHTLGSTAVNMLRSYGFEEASVDRLFRADLRFEGQEHTVTVPVEASWLDGEDTLFPRVSQRFLAMHRQLYGHGSAENPVEIVTCRCRAIGHVVRPSLPLWNVHQPANPIGVRRAFFRAAGDFVDTKVYERDTLAQGQVVHGPAVIEEWTTTITVPPGWRSTTDHLGNLVLTMHAEESL
jgi:N-methylhydantoinase A